MSHLQVVQGGEVMGMGLADYVWFDGDDLNFKKKSILIGKNGKGEPIPLVDRWTFSHTNHEDDCEQGWACECSEVRHILVPCFYLPDPTRPQPNYIVLCEVRDEHDECIEENWRAKLRQALELRGPNHKLVWFGFEQDYTLVDADESEGSAGQKFEAAERHIGACFDAGLLFHSAWNPLGADCWDFKVGYRGFPQDLDPDPPSALVVADHAAVARYLMEKIGGSKGLIPQWDDLTPFVSTPALREPGGDHDAERKRMFEALGSLGQPQHLPHPARGGFQCIEVVRDEPENPYKLALGVLDAVWPVHEQEPQ